MVWVIHDHIPFLDGWPFLREVDMVDGVRVRAWASPILIQKDVPNIWAAKKRAGWFFFGRNELQGLRGLCFFFRGLETSPFGGGLEIMVVMINPFWQVFKRGR